MGDGGSERGERERAHFVKRDKESEGEGGRESL